MVARIGPWFAATVVGAVALLVGLAIAQIMPVEYGASGRIVIPTAAARSLGESWPDASTVNRWLAQPLGVRPTAKTSVSGDAQSPSRLIVAAISAHGDDAAESVNRVLETAHAELSARGPRFTQERHRSLLALLHHARAERNRAQRALDRFIARRLEAPLVTAQATAASLPEPSIAPATSPVPRRNPLWDDLVRQVNELDGRRAGLLLTMTEAHPVIRDLDWRLAQLREQLRLSQEFVAAPEPSVVKPLPAIEPPVESAPSAATLTTAEDEPTLRALRKRVAAADRQLGAAVQQERAAWQELSALRAELQSCLTPAVAPSQPIDAALRDRIRWSGAILALGLAAATVRLLAPRRKVLRTSDDIHRRLGLPVLGKLSVR